jgi:hypothetical protein
MANLSTPARNSVNAQIEMFRLAKADHGLTPAAISKLTPISKSTLEGWAEGAAMPAWALGALGEAGIPDHLLSMILEPFSRHVGTDEDGEGDLDTAADEALEFAHSVQRARSPKSPGGVAIVPQERLVIVPKGNRACASIRRAAAA